MRERPLIGLVFKADSIVLTSCNVSLSKPSTEPGHARDRRSFHSDFTEFIEADVFRTSLVDAIASIALPVEARTTGTGTGAEDAESTEQQQEMRRQMIRKVRRDKSFDFEYSLEIKRTKFRARVHAALCFAGGSFSVTLRGLELREPEAQLLGKLGKTKADFYQEFMALDPDYEPWKSPHADVSVDLMDILKLSGDAPWPFLESIKTVASVVYPAIFPTRKEESREVPATVDVGSSAAPVTETADAPLVDDDSRLSKRLLGNGLQRRMTPAHGLVLVSGETGSGKTQYVNAFVYLYLRQLLATAPARRPHVLSIGDPIETRVLSGIINREGLGAVGRIQQESPRRVLDFTARVLRIDVASVKDALRDALRETPSVVIVSELREDDDFRAVLEFAATGHLVFATSHNSSLKDTMGKLMRMFRADTPSMRATLADRLKAIVHLQALEEISVAGTPRRLTLPAFWRGNSAGIRTFVGEGLSSIQHQTPKASDVEKASALGYHWAARMLGERPDCPWRAVKHEVYRQALTLDLNVR